MDAGRLADLLLPEPVPYLGVDEFAVRRGRTYATILVDTNTHRPSDALADRTAHTSAAWLREHPEVRIVCRDRAGVIDVHGRRRPLAAPRPERYQQIHERIERGDSLRAIARELHISRGTILRFARATNTEQLGAVRPIMCGAG
ncbi:transposase [Streptomyces mirabilis]|uniref:transposase n=1 Tax=Streptomyces mirabilis TaxID=68239 RepID=UPI003679E764